MGEEALEMPTDKPTKAQFEGARKYLVDHFQDFVFAVFPGHVVALRNVLDYIAPSPADERPADMAELARMVAIELRRIMGSCAAVQASIIVPRLRGTLERGYGLSMHHYSLFAEQFDNLTPSEIASVIQAEEAKKAAEWAGDT